jgi:AcrR family transcriptional regulator
MSPRRDVSEERTDQILAAAEQVVTDKGLDSLRMEDVADRTGLSKGTLYLYFKNKHDLMVAILERALQEELEAVAGISAGAASAEEALRGFVDAVIGDIESLTRFMPVSYSFISMAFRNRHVQRSLKKYFRRYRDALVPIIQSGMASGEFRTGDPEEMAIAVAAVVEGTMLLWVYDRSVIDPARHIRSGLDSMLRGLIRHECK